MSCWMIKRKHLQFKWPITVKYWWHYSLPDDVSLRPYIGASLGPGAAVSSGSDMDESHAPISINSWSSRMTMSNCCFISNFSKAWGTPSSSMSVAVEGWLLKTAWKTRRVTGTDWLTGSVETGGTVAIRLGISQGPFMLSKHPPPVSSPWGWIFLTASASSTSTLASDLWLLLSVPGRVPGSCRLDDFNSSSELVRRGLCPRPSSPPSSSDAESGIFSKVSTAVGMPVRENWSRWFLGESVIGIMYISYGVCYTARPGDNGITSFGESMEFNHVHHVNSGSEVKGGAEHRGFSA